VSALPCLPDHARANGWQPAGISGVDQHSGDHVATAHVTPSRYPLRANRSESEVLDGLWWQRLSQPLTTTSGRCLPRGKGHAESLVRTPVLDELIEQQVRLLDQQLAVTNRPGYR
jgi:hypothetical protein